MDAYALGWELTSFLAILHPELKTMEPAMSCSCREAWGLLHSLKSIAACTCWVKILHRSQEDQLEDTLIKFRRKYSRQKLLCPKKARSHSKGRLYTSSGQYIIVDIGLDNQTPQNWDSSALCPMHLVDCTTNVWSFTLNVFYGQQLANTLSHQVLQGFFDERLIQHRISNLRTQKSSSSTQLPMRFCKMLAKS
jgi:hypothetical protein